MAGSSNAQAGEDEKALTLYSLGYLSAGGLGGAHMTAHEQDMLLKGVFDSVNGHVLRTHSTADRNDQLITRLKARYNKPFLERAAKMPGYRRLPSGVLFRAVREGTGLVPKTNDFVILDFVGRLSDGSTFESTKVRRQFAAFSPKAVVPCWTESFALMKEGGEYEMVCPSDRAFGPQGFVPLIPSEEVVSFEVRLVRVIPAGKDIPKELDGVSIIEAFPSWLIRLIPSSPADAGVKAK